MIMYFVSFKQKESRVSDFITLRIREEYIKYCITVNLRVNHSCILVQHTGDFIANTVLFLSLISLQGHYLSFISHYDVLIIM